MVYYKRKEKEIQERGTVQWHNRTHPQTNEMQERGKVQWHKKVRLAQKKP